MEKKMVAEPKNEKEAKKRRKTIISLHPLCKEIDQLPDRGL